MGNGTLYKVHFLNSTPKAVIMVIIPPAAKAMLSGSMWCPTCITRIHVLLLKVSGKRPDSTFY